MCFCDEDAWLVLGFIGFLEIAVDLLIFGESFAFVGVLIIIVVLVVLF